MDGRVLKRHRWTIAELYGLEKDIIKRNKLPIKPRPIKIIYHEVDYGGRAGVQLELSSSSLKSCNKNELIDILKHELVHYVRGTNHGHDLKFLNVCKRIGSSIGQYELGRNYDEARARGQLVSTLANGEEKCSIMKYPTWKIFNYNMVECEAQGMLFRGLRRYNGLSLKEVASEAGLSRYMIKLIESANNVKRPWGRHAINRKRYSRYIDDALLMKILFAINRLARRKARASRKAGYP